MANGLSQIVKEVCNIDCSKNCRAVYQIFNGAILDSKRAHLNEIIRFAANRYATAKEEEKKKLFLEFGPTLPECSNYDCFMPFILKQFGGGDKLMEYIIRQEAAIEDFKWVTGIADEGEAWEIWTREVGEDGLTHSDRFHNQNYESMMKDSH